jgi:hypothetical protein
VPRSAGTVHERLHQLENLVVSLMRHDRDEPVSRATESDSDPKLASRSASTPIRDTEPTSSWREAKDLPNAAQSTPTVPEIEDNLSPPLDLGSMTLNDVGAAEYVGGIHWASILNSIDDIKLELEHEEETATTTKNVDTTWPQLLYGCERATTTEILSSVPPRYIVDQLISTYLTLDIAPGKSLVSKYTETISL